MNYDNIPKLAFPFNSEQRSQVSDGGMSLRDYFAAQAIAGLATDPVPISNLARYAYDLADEMMKAREA